MSSKKIIHKSSSHRMASSSGKSMTTKRFQEQNKVLTEMRNAVMSGKVDAKYIKATLHQLQNSIGPGGNGLLYGQLGAPQSASPMSQPWTLSDSNNYVPLTLNRILLTFGYMTHGIFQTAVDQPVLDAFRGGFIIDSPELDPDEDIPKLQEYLVENHIMHEIVYAHIWARLYGGAGIIINTPQDTKMPLRREFMDYPDIPLSFVAADRWELTMAIVNFTNVDFPYNYYGTPLHNDRVIRLTGKEAPAFIRPQLMGWGFSVLEHMIRDLNAYIRAQESLFQILKEANIDVWRLLGFNDTILSDLAQGKINRRIQNANYLKSTYNSIMMDKEDEFVQRTQTFAGWGEVLHQLRLGVCSALRMPMAKVYGISAAGLGAGEDDIENYNGMIESEIREPALPVCHQVVSLACRQLFGFEPELTVKFKPLRVLSAVEEEEVKTSKQNRLFMFYDRGLSTPQETMQTAKKEELYTSDTAVLKGAEPEPPMLGMGMGMDEEDGDGEDDPKPGDKKKNAKTK